MGGGSAIDSAKAIREFASRVGGLDNIALIAVPTTSGTGSEVTSFSVISDPQEQRKYPLVSESLLPTEAILDAELTRSVPPAITADTGMDVFTHAMEAYVSTQSTEFSAALSEKAIEICGTFLLRAYLDGNDTHARKKMHIASCLAGLSFNAASLGINHSLAHQLGAHFHIAWGKRQRHAASCIEYNSMITKNSRIEDLSRPGREVLHDRKTSWRTELQHCDHDPCPGSLGTVHAPRDGYPLKHFPDRKMHKSRVLQSHPGYGGGSPSGRLHPDQSETAIQRRYHGNLRKTLVRKSDLTAQLPLFSQVFLYQKVPTSNRTLCYAESPSDSLFFLISHYQCRIPNSVRLHVKSG